MDDLTDKMAAFSPGETVSQEYDGVEGDGGKRTQISQFMLHVLAVGGGQQ